MAQEIIRLEGITKYFPGVVANENVSISVQQGTIRGLVGENGAGKTTLMRIVYGMYHPDAGKIFFKDHEVRFSNPRDAMAAGVSMVHQHSMLVPQMTIPENILLAKPHGSILDFNQVKKELAAVMQRYEMELDLSKPTGKLTVAERQRAEILKALYCEADLIILDEPTTVLTPQEADLLFQTLRKLSKAGKTIILITHKLPEVMRATDEVTILRGGRVITTKKTSETNDIELASLMVGRAVKLRRNRSADPAAAGDRLETLLSVDTLSVEDDTHHLRVKNVSFQVGKGEIVGIAAVQGNGQSELIEAIVGLRKAKSGNIRFAGQDITRLNPHQRRGIGFQYVPRDRQQRGLNSLAEIRENLIMGHHDSAPLAVGGRLDLKTITNYSQELITKFKIATPSVHVLAKNLSGGNQQKMVIARELAQRAPFVIVEEPTQGVDVSAIEFIHDTLIQLSESGVAVLLVSSSLDEILDLSDRIVVMYSGEIMGTLPFSAADEHKVGRLMMGIKEK
jgi:general nucleoside transport system ATP-binding protein